MAKLKVNLEEGNGVFYAHAAEFLGCCGSATTKDDAINALLKDVKNYSEWLLSKDFTNDYMKKAKDFLAGINELQVIEEITGVASLGTDTGASALFKSDQEDINEEDFEFFIEVIRTLPEGLMKIVFQYSNEQREREILAEHPTINQALAKIYTTELFYISRFIDEIEQKFFEAIKLTKDELESLSLYERIIKVQQGYIALLRRYYANHAGKTYSFKEDPEYPSEDWTIRKIVRRLIEHERECINTIRFLVDELDRTLATEKTE